MVAETCAGTPTTSSISGYCNKESAVVMCLGRTAEAEDALDRCVQAMIGLRIWFRVRVWLAKIQRRTWELNQLQHKLVNVLA